MAFAWEIYFFDGLLLSVSPSISEELGAKKGQVFVENQNRAAQAQNLRGPSPRGEGLARKIGS